jgi:hypothetical protein
MRICDQLCFLFSAPCNFVRHFSLNRFAIAFAPSKLAPCGCANHIAAIGTTPRWAWKLNSWTCAWVCAPGFYAVPLNLHAEILCSAHEFVRRGFEQCAGVWYILAHRCPTVFRLSRWAWKLNSWTCAWVWCILSHRCTTVFRLPRWAWKLNSWTCAWVCAPEFYAVPLNLHAGVLCSAPVIGAFWRTDVRRVFDYPAGHGS